MLFVETDFHAISSIFVMRNRLFDNQSLFKFIHIISLGKSNFDWRKLDASLRFVLLSSAFSLLDMDSYIHSYTPGLYKIVVFHI